MGSGCVCIRGTKVGGWVGGNNNGGVASTSQARSSWGIGHASPVQGDPSGAGPTHPTLTDLSQEGEQTHAAKPVEVVQHQRLRQVAASRAGSCGTLKPINWGTPAEAAQQASANWLSALRAWAGQRSQTRVAGIGLQPATNSPQGGMAAAAEGTCRGAAAAACAACAQCRARSAR